jgi:hypothetical protein
VTGDEEDMGDRVDVDRSWVTLSPKPPGIYRMRLSSKSGRHDCRPLFELSPALGLLPSRALFSCPARGVCHGSVAGWQVRGFVSRRLLVRMTENFDEIKEVWSTPPSNCSKSLRSPTTDIE